MYRMFPGHKELLEGLTRTACLLCDESPTPDIDTIKLVNVCHADPEGLDKTIKRSTLRMKDCIWIFSLSTN